MRENSPVSALLPTLGLLALGLGLGAIFKFIGRQQNLDVAVPEFIALTLAAGSIYLVGVYFVEQFPFRWPALLIILLGAIAFRLQLLPSAPSLSEDVYRYQWEGRVQRFGLNPYTVSPATPGLESLEDLKHPLNTGRSVPTLYPPLSEWLFSLVRTVPGFIRMFTGLDLACVAVLLALLAARGQPLHRVLIHAWNPTVIISFALSGHHDSLAIFTLLLACLCIIHRRPAPGFAFLALSVISKFFSVLLAPVFLKHSRTVYAVIFCLAVALGYLPYAAAGPGLLKGLGAFAAGWEGNDSLFRLLSLAGNSKAQAGLVAGVFILALVAYALKRQLEPFAASVLLIAGLLFLSPNAFPWYFTWLIPFLCFYPRSPLLLLSITCVLGYSPVVTYAAGQPYRDSPLILALEYVPVYGWLAVEGWRSTQAAGKPRAIIPEARAGTQF